MKRIELALLAAALLLPTPAALADDPPSRADDASDASSAATAAKEAATDSIRVEEVPDGAASMEPSEKESPEERSARAFIENVWDSP